MLPYNIAVMLTADARLCALVEVLGEPGVLESQVLSLAHGRRAGGKDLPGRPRWCNSPNRRGTD